MGWWLATRKFSAALLFAAFLFCGEAKAFKLTPMSATFEPTGPGSAQAFVLENDGAEKIAVQVSMVRRVVDLDGTEQLPDASDQFIVYPTQVILQPKEKRTVRVAWNGPQSIPTELAYRIIAEQLPVEGLQKAQAKQAVINVMLKYQGSVYIDPPETEAKIVVDSVEPLEESNPRISVIVKNRGTRHQILNAPRLWLKAESGAEVEVPVESLQEMSGQNILAGQRRRFILTWPKDLPRRTTKVKLEARLEFRPS